MPKNADIGQAPETSKQDAVRIASSPAAAQPSAFNLQKPCPAAEAGNSQACIISFFLLVMEVLQHEQGNCKMVQR